MIHFTLYTGERMYHRYMHGYYVERIFNQSTESVQRDTQLSLGKIVGICLEWSQYEVARKHTTNFTTTDRTELIQHFSNNGTIFTTPARWRKIAEVLESVHMHEYVANIFSMHGDQIGAHLARQRGKTNTPL